MLHVGTNNIDHTPEEVTEGILEIIRTIKEKQPNAYIVLPVSNQLISVFSNLIQTFINNHILIFLEFTSSRSASK